MEDNIYIGEQYSIIGYKNYILFPREGKIYSTKTKRMVGYKNEDGYIKCSFYDNNSNRTFTSIHRIIYSSINGEIPKGYEVNHIDEDKNNNSIFNLELCDRTYNNNYGSHNDKIKQTKQEQKGRCKAVGAFKNGELIITFPSIAEATRQGYGSDRSIAKCCYGKLKTHRGLQWKFI